MRQLSLFSCLGLAALLAGCPDRTVSKVVPDQGRVEYKDIPVTVNKSMSRACPAKKRAGVRVPSEWLMWSRITCRSSGRYTHSVSPLAMNRPVARSRTPAT